MNYDEVAAAFLTPLATEIAAPTVPDTPARRLRDAAEAISTIGWWSRAAGDGFGRAGLDFFGGYLWGRAAPLGAEVEPSVVVSAFGVFDSAMVEAVLVAARAGASRERVLAERERGASEGLRAATADVAVDVVERSATRLRGALDAVSGSGRALFSALRALPAPADPHGALWRAAEMYREHRGDGHLAACVVAGLDPVEMNVLTELWVDYAVGEYCASRGFDEERIARAVATLGERGWVDADGRLTDAGRGARDGIERATDASQQAVIEALGDDVDELIDDLDVIGGAVIAAAAAPADPRKRAAG